MDVGNSRKVGLEAPGMEKINPVDIRGYFMNFIIAIMAIDIVLLSHLILNS